MGHKQARMGEVRGIVVDFTASCKKREQNNEQPELAASCTKLKPHASTER